MQIIDFVRISVSQGNMYVFTKCLGNKSIITQININSKICLQNIVDSQTVYLFLGTTSTKKAIKMFYIDFMVYAKFNSFFIN